MSQQALLDDPEQAALLSYGRVAFIPASGHRRAMWGIAAKPHVMIRVKRLFPRARPDAEGTLVLQHSNEVARDLAWLMDRHPLAIDPFSRAQLDRGVREHREAEDNVAAILAGTKTFQGERTPAQHSRPYQVQAADVVTVMRRTVIADALGLGKTHSGALTFRNADSLPGVVVPQTHLARQWERELAVIWPDLTVYVPKKSTPDTHFEKWCAKNGGPPDLYVVPYSKLDGWQHHLQDVVKSVVFDEVQELRGGIGTNKGAAAANLASRSNYVAGLTATPIYNYGDEIHSIYSIVSPDSLGSREEFLREWGGRQWSQQGGKQKATIKNPKALSMFLRDNGLMIGRTRKDVGRELPFGDVEKVPHTIDADPAVLEKLSGDAVELARLILAKSSDREQRFRASGELDSMLRQATGLAKAPFVASFVSSLIKGEQTEKVVLWGWHHAVYDVWTERLKRQGIRVARYTGSESLTAKEQAIARFKAPTEHPQAADVLIMSVRSGAGLDGLQKVCSVGVFGELDWSSKVMDQCAGRLARDGQENAVVTYYLMADSGADPEMVQALDLKHAQAAPFEDPNAEVLSALPDPTNRIRSLAEDVLRQAGAR